MTSCLSTDSRSRPNPSNRCAVSQTSAGSVVQDLPGDDLPDRAGELIVLIILSRERFIQRDAEPVIVVKVEVGRDVVSEDQLQLVSKHGCDVSAAQGGLPRLSTGFSPMA